VADSFIRYIYRAARSLALPTRESHGMTLGAGRRLARA
jgi:hypothetical protein